MYAILEPQWMLVSPKTDLILRGSLVFQLIEPEI